MYVTAECVCECLLSVVLYVSVCVYYLSFYQLGLGHERLLLESVQEIHIWQDET